MKNSERPVVLGVFRSLFVLLLVGGFLLSHTLPGAVPLALAGLASGFGMGPGVSPPLLTTGTGFGAHTLVVVCGCCGVSDTG